MPASAFLAVDWQDSILAGKSPMAIVDEFYLAALSRYPTDDERQFWQQKLVDKETPSMHSAHYLRISCGV